MLQALVCVANLQYGIDLSLHEIVDRSLLHGRTSRSSGARNGAFFLQPHVWVVGVETANSIVSALQESPGYLKTDQNDQNRLTHNSGYHLNAKTSTLTGHV